jgi:hypothetical protein
MRPFAFVIASTMVASVSACSIDEEGILSPGASQGHGEAGSGAASDAPPDEVEPEGGRGGCPSPPDCSNPACGAMGYACVPPAPAGQWTIASIDERGDASCPPGSDTPYEVETSPTGDSARCGCAACSLSELPSCVSGEIDLAGSTALYETCSGNRTFSAKDGACTDIVARTLPSHVQVLDSPGASGGACKSSMRTTVPPARSTRMLVCPQRGAASTKGCSAGDVCVATRPAQTLCVIEPDEASCRGSYSVAHAAGKAIKDTRSCAGSCACGEPSASCDDRTLSFYTALGCKGTRASIGTDGGCDPVEQGVVTAYFSFQYTADPKGVACGAPSGTPTPVGSVSLTSPLTVCCLP